MNKILIVGHPLSGYQEVERLLRACGMAPALPSRRDGFLPEQISATLAKAHNAPALQRLGDGDGNAELRQLTPGPVWHGMALDLMLGNIDQPLWGWADPQAIHWLNYWRDLDPDLHFILVYDRPHSLLTRSQADPATPDSPEDLARQARQWAAYNAALLHFFHRNPQRCLLVHSEQARRSASAYLNQVRARIDAPWAERIALEGSHPEPHASGTPTPSVTQDLPPALASGDTGETPDAPLALLVADTLLRDQPESRQLYEELQAAANLPLALDDEPGRDTALALQAWAALNAQRQQQRHQDKLLRQLEAGQTQAEALAAEHWRLLQAEQQLRAQDAQTHSAALADLSTARQQIEQQQRELQQDNDLLLSQLHQVQEELERHYLNGQQQATQLETLSAQQQQAEQQAAQFKERLAAAEARAAKELADLQQQKRQLEVRLGAAENRAAEEAKRVQQQAEQTQQLKATLSELQARPAVDPQLSEENDLLLSQLHRVQEELERYYLENQRLKAQVAPPKPEKPAFYGAADRVRQQLSYRIGARMIHNSRSLGGWIAMPWAVLGEVRRFKREQPEREARKLPPIHTYRDAHEAERVKQHLSYRLGRAYLANAKSPIGWLRMPFALSREAKAFRQRQHT